MTPHSSDHIGYVGFLLVPGFALLSYACAIEAAERLALRYGARDCGRAVVLGTTAGALAGALALMQAGVFVAAVIEALPAAVGPAHLVERVAALGIPVLCGHTVRGAEGHAGVQACLVAPRDAGGEAAVRRIACDTIVIGVGTVPVIELLDVAGCHVAWDAAGGAGVGRRADDRTRRAFRRCSNSTWRLCSINAGSTRV